MRTIFAFMNGEMVHESQIVLHPLFYKYFMCFSSVNAYILLFESQGPFLSCVARRMLIEK